jgi:hypothetical protein
VLDILSVDWLAAVLHDLDRVVAVADSALIERALHAIVRRAFSDPERIIKLRVPALPVPTVVTPKAAARSASVAPSWHICAATLAYAGMYLVGRPRTGLSLSAFLPLLFFLPRTASSTTGVPTFSCFRHGASLCWIAATGGIAPFTISPASTDGPDDPRSQVLPVTGCCWPTRIGEIPPRSMPPSGSARRSAAGAARLNSPFVV